MTEYLAPLRDFGALAGVPEAEEFAAASGPALRGSGRAEILGGALQFTLGAGACPLEVSFISPYAALESVLTYARRRGDGQVFPRTDGLAFEGPDGHERPRRRRLRR